MKNDKEMIIFVLLFAAFVILSTLNFEETKKEINSSLSNSYCIKTQSNNSRLEIFSKNDYKLNDILISNSKNNNCKIVTPTKIYENNSFFIESNEDILDVKDMGKVVIGSKENFLKLQSSHKKEMKKSNSSVAGMTNSSSIESMILSNYIFEELLKKGIVSKEEILKDYLSTETSLIAITERNSGFNKETVYYSLDPYYSLTGLETITGKYISSKITESETIILTSEPVNYESRDDTFFENLIYVKETYSETVSNLSIIDDKNILKTESFLFDPYKILLGDNYMFLVDTNVLSNEEFVIAKFSMYSGEIKEKGIRKIKGSFVMDPLSKKPNTNNYIFKYFNESKNISIFEM